MTCPSILQWIKGWLARDPTYLNEFNDAVSASLAWGISDAGIRDRFGRLRKQIDDDLSRPRQATSVLRRCDLLAMRNVLAPISSLPGEVLSDVFRFNVEDDNFEYDSPAFGTNGTAPTLKTVTHVCSYWRQVALASHCLWSEALNFLDEHPDWTLQMLRRSGGLPLKIHADLRVLQGRWCSDVKRVATNVGLGLDFISQVQSVHLCAKSPAFGHLLKAMKSGAPALESLSLAYVHDIVTPLCQIPKSLFDSSMPVL
jgi:hypothetical protein